MTCIARCICCGAECACCCFKCCTGCCGGGGRSGHKRVKSDPTPTYPTSYGAPVANPYAQAHAAAPTPPVDARPINQQYRSNAMPTFNGSAAPERPQFATFDSTRAVVNDDALPAMPTWKDGRDVHIEVEEQAVPEKRGDMEMNRLDHNGSMTSGSLTAMGAVGGARRSPGPRSPVSPLADNYGFPPGYQNDSFMNAVPHGTSPSPQRGPYAPAPQDDYRRGSPGASLSPVHGTGGGYGQSQQYGRTSPGQAQAYDSYNQPDQYSHGGQSHQPNYYDEPEDRYHSPAPPTTNAYHQPPGNSAPYGNSGLAPQRSHTPGYAPSESTVYEPSTVSAYPGQQTYNASPVYPGQQSYQAFQPTVPQGQQYSGMSRKPLDGSHRDT